MLNSFAVFLMTVLLTVWFSIYTVLVLFIKYYEIERPKLVGPYKFDVIIVKFLRTRMYLQLMAQSFETLKKKIIPRPFLAFKG